MIKGVILETSVLFSEDKDTVGGPRLRGGADFLFRALQFSLPHKGIHFGEDLSADKVHLLKLMAQKYSFDCFMSNASTAEPLTNEIAVSWGDIGLNTLYVISCHNNDVCDKLCDHGLLLTVLDFDTVEDTKKHPSISYIKKLEELPLNICRLNRKVAGNSVVVVGYSMKPSRQVDFAKRGAFPLYSSEQKLMFLPLTYELPIPFQLKEMDVVLHKSTDDIISIELNAFDDAPKITYTNGMEELKSALEDHPSCCVIDPFHYICPVLDRLKIQDILLGLEDLSKEGRSNIRGPHFLKVNNFNDPKMTQRLLQAKLSLPSIVKPQVACGVSSAHSMAIVFSLEDYKDLSVPLPAIIQEYVDHSSTLFKFYVLGENVFHTVKKSIPNADVLIKLSQVNQLKPLLFDSLKSLPTADKSQFGDEALDLELVNNAASWLRRKLDLTIFGFDVVIQEGTGDHVIVDVNYLPSFKEVADDVAIPALWDVIRNRCYEKRQTITTIN